MSGRTIIVDVDDTISTHINRDYVNATPHIEVITKLNDLYDAGWEIIYFTARGQVSCGGNLALIEERNRAILEAWMDKHGVKRSKLLFGKPYGAYYIDDKALKPSEFLSMNFNQFNGRSGASLVKDGHLVSKACANANEQFNWLKTAPSLRYEELLITPVKVHSFFPGAEPSYTMDFIQGSPLHQLKINDEITALLKYNALLATIRHEETQFYSYLNYATRSLTEREKSEITSLFSFNDAEFYSSNASFCHGDFTLNNILKQNTELILIDPIYKKNIWQSYLIDIGRIRQSIYSLYELRVLNEGLTDQDFTRMNKLLTEVFGSKILLQMELLIWCRILPYLSNDSERSVCTATVSKLIEELKNVKQEKLRTIAWS